MSNGTTDDDDTTACGTIGYMLDDAQIWIPRGDVMGFAAYFNTTNLMKNHGVSRRDAQRFREMFDDAYECLLNEAHRLGVTYKVHAPFAENYHAPTRPPKDP